MLDLNTLSEEQKEYLQQELDGIYFEPFTLETRLKDFNLDFEEKFKIKLDLKTEDFELFFETLELRHCENCGIVENIYNGGGTINSMVCCSDCYDKFADEVEED